MLSLSGHGAPLAVASGSVESLPHQIAVLERALTTNPTRLLLADEVGLGKTIEAGLIVRELKARGRVRRIVIVAPKGVQLQWVAEFHNRFGEKLVRVGPEGLPVNAGVDPWRAFDQVVCSIDAVKPLR
jgi:SNF2 family DNA or RNA helicase